MITPQKKDRGHVCLRREGTVQVRPYHPVSVVVELRLPIEDGETPQRAIERVDAIVASAHDAKMEEVVREGWRWGG